MNDLATLTPRMDELRVRLINVEGKIDALIVREIPIVDPKNQKLIRVHKNRQLFGDTTYSQHGDDIVVANIFHTLGLNKPSYLDLGAHDPFDISNTALFYSLGSRGVNVEANPGLIQAFQTQRPEDVNVNVGVGPKDGELTFYVFGDFSGLNTFDEERAKALSRQSQTPIRKTMKVKVLSVNSIVANYCGGKFPDFLSVDLEGMDEQVIKGMDMSASRPKVICVEANSDKERERMRCILAEKNFTLYFRAFVNLIFVDNQFVGQLR